MLAGSVLAGHQTRRIVAKRNGSVAWTVSLRGDAPPPEVQEVRIADASGAVRTLDSGPDIDPSSLTLSADRRSISWTKAGLRRTAPID